MKFASLEHYGLSPWRLACVGVSFSCSAWFAADLVLGSVLGGAKLEVLVLLSCMVFYLVVTIPRRLYERQRASEAREAVLLSASARTYLQVSGSRPRTLMMLRAQEKSIARALAGAAKLVLLGAKVEDALLASSGGLASYTAEATVRSIASLRPEGFEAGDEEAKGLESSGEMSRETRLPMFMTVCFFAPIMLILYAVFSGVHGAAGVAELTAFEFIAVDIAFYLSSGDRRVQR